MRKIVAAIAFLLSCVLGPVSMAADYYVSGYATWTSANPVGNDSTGNDSGNAQALSGEAGRTGGCWCPILRSFAGFRAGERDVRSGCAVGNEAMNFHGGESRSGS